MTYTPGPWKIDVGAKSEDFMIVSEFGEPICNIIKWTPEQDIADVRLIASAPDLLKACQMALAEIKSPSSQWYVEETIEAAIAKATGAA